MIFWLVLARFVHFAASIFLAAVFVFRLVVIGPAAVSMDRMMKNPQDRGGFDRMTIFGWLMVILSGFAWFGLVAVSLGGETSLLALNPGTTELILFGTQFGQLWIFRFGCCFA